MEKVTAEHLESLIKSVTYYRVEIDGKPTNMTQCYIELVNGFILTGESSCLNAADYNKDLGEDYAYNEAFAKMWQLEGYHRAMSHANS